MGQALITRKGGREFLRFEKDAEIYAVEDIPANSFVEGIRDSYGYLMSAHCKRLSHNLGEEHPVYQAGIIHYRDNYYIYLDDTSVGGSGQIRVRIIKVLPGDEFSYTIGTLLNHTLIGNTCRFHGLAEKIADDLIICYYHGSNASSDTYKGCFCVVKINETDGIPVSATLINHDQLYRVEGGNTTFSLTRFFKIDNDKVIFVGFDKTDTQCRILYFTFNSSGELSFQGSASLESNFTTKYVGVLYNKNTNNIIVTTQTRAYEIPLSEINGGTEPGKEAYIPAYNRYISFIPSQYNFIEDNCYYGLTNSESGVIAFKILDNTLQQTEKTFDREDNIITQDGVALFDKKKKKIIINGNSKSVTQWFAVSLSDLIHESRINFKTFSSGLYEENDRNCSETCYCHDDKYYYYFTHYLGSGDSKDYLRIKQYTTIPQCRLATNASTSMVGISKKAIGANSFGTVYTK